MQQNKIRKESSISSQVKWVLLSIFTDHKRFKEQISHASWGDQTVKQSWSELRSWRCLEVLGKHITGKEWETYLSISERHNLWKGDLVKPFLVSRKELLSCLLLKDETFIDWPLRLWWFPPWAQMFQCVMKMLVNLLCFLTGLKIWEIFSNLLNKLIQDLNCYLQKE